MASRHPRGTRAALALTAALALVSCSTPGTQPQEEPSNAELSLEHSPIMNSYNTNRDQALLTLKVLSVRPSPMHGYSPERFAIDQDKPARDADWPPTALANEHCTVPNATLARDAVGATVDENTCEVSGGQWFDPLTGETHSRQDVQARPFLPPERAWAAGANEWSDYQFAVYRNAPESVMTISDEAYQERGQRGPGQWRPAEQDQWCGYALRWVSEKNTYGLFAEDQAEKDALTEMLNTCPDNGFIPHPA